MDVDVKTAINEAKEAKEAADVQVTTAKAQVAAANRDKIKAEQAKIKAEQAKIKALEAEAKAREAKTEAEAQAQAQAEAAKIEAEKAKRKAEKAKRKALEAEAKAQAQVEAAQTQARKQAEAAKTEAEAKVRESQKRVLEVEQQLEEANQAKIEEETKTRNELQAEKEARTKAEEKVIADNSIIEQLNNDIKANNEQIKNMKYLGDGTKKTLDNLKGAMEKVADYIESIKDQISSDKMDQIYNISKINGVFESIKKLNESNGKDISMIFSSLLNFPEQIKDQIEKILIEGEDNNKRAVISLLNRLIDNKGIVDEAQKDRIEEFNENFISLIGKKEEETKAFFVESQNLLKTISDIIKDYENPLDTIDAPVDATASTLPADDTPKSENPEQEHDGGSINDGNGKLKLDILNYNHMGGTNGGPIKKQIYDMIDTLSKNDEKIEGIVCSNRENQRKLDEIKLSNESGDDPSELRRTSQIESTMMKQQLRDKAAEARRSLEGRIANKKIEKENESREAGPTAMPPPSDGGGSLSLDY